MSGRFTGWRETNDVPKFLLEALGDDVQDDAAVSHLDWGWIFGRDEFDEAELPLPVVAYFVKYKIN